MRTKAIGFMTGVCFLAILFTPFVFAKSTPKLNDGKKWRIAYYEGGPYSDYTEEMRTLVHGLIDLGWLPDIDPPEYHKEMPKPYIEWLHTIKSPYLSFKPENCYSANWDKQLRLTCRNELLKKLKNSEIDLVIAMGTWAGIDLANNEHKVPVLVLSTSDPIEAGIIRSAEDSGLDHVTARVDPNRYLRQLRMFHRIAGFSTLGIAFEDTPDGRTYSAMDEVQTIAKEMNFKIRTCKVFDTTPDTQKSDRSCLACYRELSENVDAVYVTGLTCVDRKAKEIADIFISKRIPSFSMVGSKFVKEGMLFSISSDSGYAAKGKYNANKIGEILNGTTPRVLNQICEDPLEIAVNIKTAQKIHFSIPGGILKIAAEIYGE
ncbi:ABC transporter substrate-binding protein [Desulfogranum japonicum]|uniref:ABC transporter substrate-binding protein n=1 Tax=Desulfogranum japonicum TaxID=231447 RepID=UPI000405DFCE|nr:ABC transporter substrate binding protein [Desulfogranum japonicum]